MELKTFEVASMRDASKKIRKEFGADALIVNSTQKFDENGKKVYQVTVANGDSYKSGASAFGNEPFVKDLQHISKSIIELNSKVSELSSCIEKMPTWDHLESMLVEINHKINQNFDLQTEFYQKDSSQHIKAILNRLMLMEVDTAEVKELAEFLHGLPSPAVNKNGPSVMTEKEYYDSHAIKWVMNRVETVKPFSPREDSSNIHFIVGASGSGKTTMIAKLASNFQKQYGNNILLVKYDPYAQSIDDKLKTYAKLFGINYELCDQADALESIINRNSHSDIILIDCTSINPKKIKLIEDVIKSHEKNFPFDTHLVLSAAEKSDHLARQIRAYSTTHLTSVMFSKLDECWNYGDIYNVSSLWSLALSYFSTGSTIPKDIEKATKERIAERLFGL